MVANVLKFRVGKRAKKSNRTTFIKMATYLFGALFSYLAGVHFLLTQAYGVYDAEAYVIFASEISRGDINSLANPARTYLYLVFLAFLLAISSHTEIQLALVVFNIQWVLYIASAAFCSWAVGRRVTTKVFGLEWSAVLFLVITLNITVSPYLSLTLTDSVYISLFLLFLGLLVYALQENELKTKLNFILISIFVCSLAVVVRPAAIWMMFISMVFFVSTLLALRILRSIFFGLAKLFLALSPLYVQIYLNFVNFGIFSFLPSINLGALQIKWGIENIKYATWLGADFNASNFYSSEAVIGSLQGQELSYSWYLFNPILAFKLVFTKLVGAFDFDYLVAYPTSKFEYSFIVSTISFLILVIGLVAIVSNFRHKNMVEFNSRIFPAAVFLCWSAITVTSAVELRFTLPILLFLSLICASYLRVLYVDKNYKQLKILTLMAAIFVPMMFLLAIFVRGQAIVQLG